MGNGDDPELHLVVDGVRVLPREEDGAHVFVIEAPARAVRLVSRSVAPAALGPSGDHRVLGFALARLVLTHADGARDLPLASDELFDGFHAWETAGFRWTNGNAALPDSLFAKLRGPVALTVAGFGLPSYGASDPASVEDRRLFAAFENLGDDCEFAFVQSSCGLEPAGLLRWGSASLPQLEAGFGARFRDLGNPACTRMEWREDTGEYRWIDPRYLQAHTGLTERQADPADEAALRDRTTARLSMLRRKLLADIAAGEKIFVFKSSDSATSLVEFRRLHAAMRGIAPTRLLCVRLAGAGDRPGDLHDCGDGLMVGAIDRFVRNAGPYDVWRDLCRRAQAVTTAGAAVNA